MEESSSSRKEWLAAVLLSTISCFIRPSTCSTTRPFTHVSFDTSAWNKNGRWHYLLQSPPHVTLKDMKCGLKQGKPADEGTDTTKHGTH